MAVTAIELQPRAALDNEACDEHIVRTWQASGGRALMPGHLCRRDERFEHGEFSRDPLEPSRPAGVSKAGDIAFRGERFTADRARIALERMLDI